MSFQIQATEKQPVSPPSNSFAASFQAFKETPAFTVIVNVGLFAAGIAFIQSSLMDNLAPQF